MRPVSAHHRYAEIRPGFFALLSGMAHITFPYNDQEAWVMEGVNGFLVANDVTGIGHYTTYPSDKETVALQVPFEGGAVPDHEVLGKGACHQTSRFEFGIEGPEEFGQIEL